MSLAGVSLLSPFLDVYFIVHPMGVRAVQLLNEHCWLRPVVLPFWAYSVHGHLRSEDLLQLLIDGGVAVPPLRSHSMWP